MDVVMVPVPEDLVGAVERFLMMKGMMSRGVSVDSDSLARLLPTLDSRCRKILLAVADAKLSEADMTVSQLARSLGWNVHETVGIAYELGELLLAAFGPTVVVSSVVSTDLDKDALDWDSRIVFVSVEVARAIVDAERRLADVEG
jgi:hypothetical protein